MTDFDQVLARFPERANEIRRMCLRDSFFRSICEDLILAYGSLGRSGLNGDAGLSPAARELRSICEELEAELLAHLDRGRDEGRSRI
jgi:hypothetical protein